MHFEKPKFEEEFARFWWKSRKNQDTFPFPPPILFLISNFGQNFLISVRIVNKTQIFYHHTPVIASNSGKNLHDSSSIDNGFGQDFLFCPEPKKLSATYVVDIFPGTKPKDSPFANCRIPKLSSDWD